MHFSAPTPPPNDPDGFEAWEIDAVKAIVTAFIAARGRFRSLDFEDLVQECLVHWWQQRKRYAEGRGASRRTFMNRVLTNRLRDLRREERAEKRRADRDALSLDAPLRSEENEALALADLLADDNTESRPETAVEHAERAAAIEKGRRGLSRGQQELLDGIRAERSMSELSRSLGIPRTSLYDELERIKREFQTKRLDDHLR